MLACIVLLRSQAEVVAPAYICEEIWILDDFELDLVSHASLRVFNLHLYNIVTHRDTVALLCRNHTCELIDCERRESLRKIYKRECLFVSIHLNRLNRILGILPYGRVVVVKLGNRSNECNHLHLKYLIEILLAISILRAYRHEHRLSRRQ